MIFCAVCKKLKNGGSDGELYQTDVVGVYEFICIDCARQIFEDAEEGA